MIGQGWTATKQGIDAIVKEQIAECGQDSERTVEIDAYKSVSATMASADQLMIRRANVVHALWVGFERDNPRAPVTLKRYGKRYDKPWTGDDLERLRADLREVRETIIEHVRREAS